MSFTVFCSTAAFLEKERNFVRRHYDYDVCYKKMISGHKARKTAIRTEI